MPRGNPEIYKYAKGRPKGSGNKTPILLQELESVIFELPKVERIRRLRDYRDFESDSWKDVKGAKHRVFKNFVNMHMIVAKKQEESGQADLFDSAEEQSMINAAEKLATQALQEKRIYN